LRLPSLQSRMNLLPVSLAGLNTLLSSVFQLVVIYKLGIGGQSDLYYGATVVTAVVYTLFLDPLSNVLIPMFVQKASQGNNERSDLLWNAMIVVFFGGLAMLLAIYFPIRLIFPLIFKSLRWATPAEVGKVVIFYSIYQTLFGAITVKNCYLFAFGRPVSAQLNMLVSWILSLSLLAGTNIASDVSRIAYCLVAGHLAGLLIPNLDRKALTYRNTHFRDHVGTLIRRGGPLASGSAIFKAEALLDGALASLFGAGSLTVYQLFSRMLLSISTVINSGYIQPVTKHLAESAEHGNWNILRRQTARAATRSSAAGLVCLIPLVPVLFLLHARPIRALEVYVRLFERNYSILLLMLGFLIGAVVWKVYATGLFVLRKERLFAFICIATFLVGAVFKIVGAYGAGLPGLAFGTSLYWLLGAACMTTAFLRSLKARGNAAGSASPALSLEIAPKFESAD
jgi:peptidoglycan biosynthesis protein MviN/MurJ (putative lipid II flippase)